jgi:DNA-binding transcriptional ArsR family regulator
MEIFALLAEPVRFRIIEILATGEHTSGQVADAVTTEFGVSRSAVSQHLRILARSDFAVARAEGPFRIYRLADSALEQLDLAVDRLHDLWDARFGWPYLADPMSPAMLGHGRARVSQRGTGRGSRGRSEIPFVAQVNDDIDPWQWIGD